MKRLKSLFLVVFASITLFVFNSCSNEPLDNDFSSNSVVVQDNDTTNENDSNSGDSNDDNSNNDNNPVGQEGEITLYKVIGDNITKIQDYQVSGQDLAYQQNTQKHQEIWELTKKIIPLSYRDKMSEFLIYNGEATGSAGFVFEVLKIVKVEWKVFIAHTKIVL